MPETFEQRPSRLAEIKARLDRAAVAQDWVRLGGDVSWLVERLEECAAALRDVRSWSSEQMPITIGVAVDQALAKLEALHE